MRACDSYCCIIKYINCTLLTMRTSPLSGFRRFRYWNCITSSLSGPASARWRMPLPILPPVSRRRPAEFCQLCYHGVRGTGGTVKTIFLVINLCICKIFSHIDRQRILNIRNFLTSGTLHCIRNNRILTIGVRAIFWRGLDRFCPKNMGQRPKMNASSQSARISGTLFCCTYGIFFIFHL